MSIAFLLPALLQAAPAPVSTAAPVREDVVVTPERAAEPRILCDVPYFFSAAGFAARFGIDWSF